MDKNKKILACILTAMVMVSSYTKQAYTTNVVQGAKANVEHSSKNLEECSIDLVDVSKNIMNSSPNIVKYSTSLVNYNTSVNKKKQTNSQKNSIETKVIKWNSKWTYAKNSKIHSDSVVLYQVTGKKRKGKVITINAGHGTKGGSKVKTLCHPDGSPKVTGGSTAAGATKATAVSSGTTLLNGMSEAKANLKFANILKDVLLENGYDVLMIRESDDVQLDNIARTVYANNNSDCHIALHYDSTESNKGFYYISVPNNKKYRKMEPVASNWKKHHALGNSLIEGVKNKKIKIFGSGSLAMDLTQTSYSTIPSVDLEIGDRASNYSESELKRIAEGMKDGLDQFF